MRFFHLSDLHIGKQLHHYNLKEDQEHVLGQVLSYAEQLHPDAVVIAGDIYDKTVPSAEAVTVFDWFLTELTSIRPAIPVLMIAGNHDSADRLEFAASILDRQQIHIAGNAPEDPEDPIRRVVLSDENGEVGFYLLPFLKPGYVRGGFADTQSAAEALLKKADPLERKVLVTHQFYTAGTKETKTCDSEIFSVGGTDNVDVSVLEAFDYAAMGHLHSPQQVGQERYRYCGSLLKYSVSEWEQEKSLTVVTIGEKKAEGRAEITVETLPVKPLRDVRKLRGTLREVLGQTGDTVCGDYVSITLTDEVEPWQPREQLENRYTHILEIRMDNERTRRLLSETEEEIRMEDPLTSFEEFYREMQGKEMPEEEEEILRQLLAGLTDQT